MSVQITIIGCVESDMEHYFINNSMKNLNVLIILPLIKLAMGLVMDPLVVNMVQNQMKIDPFQMDSEIKSNLEDKQLIISGLKWPGSSSRSQTCQSGAICCGCTIWKEIWNSNKLVFTLIPTIIKHQAAGIYYNQNQLILFSYQMNAFITSNWNIQQACCASHTSPAIISLE